MGIDLGDESFELDAGLVGLFVVPFLGMLR